VLPHLPLPRRATWPCAIPPHLSSASLMPPFPIGR
jgi:hypothetical protein